MYGFQQNLLRRHLGNIPMDEITTDHLKQYLGEAEEHSKPSSLGHRVRFIKSLFKWTHEEGYILKNPAAKLKEPKLGKRIPKFLSKHEIELLREGCHTSRENALFEFFYSPESISKLPKAAKLIQYLVEIGLTQLYIVSAQRKDWIMKLTKQDVVLEKSRN